jgi:putative peptidoglycan lipid II flippase
MAKESRLKDNIVQTAFLMALLTLGSKGLGFLREMAMATFFGANYVVDAFVMSQAVPGILFAGFFAAIATAYMPLLSERIEKEGEKEGDILTSQIIRILLVFSASVSIFGIVLSDGLVSIFAPGFVGETAALTSFFLKVTFSYVIFSSVTGILDNFLQYKSTFIPQILVGYGQNFILISVIIISAYTSYYFLAFGMLIAYVVRFIITAFIAKSRGFRYNRSGKDLKKTIKKIAVLGIPVFIGSGMGQINLFVDKSLASGLPEGSIAALNYAGILNGLIMSLSISILTTIIYPRLARASAQDHLVHFSQIMQKGLVLVIMIALPFSLGAIIYSGDLVQIVFERGAFDISATSLTAGAYLFYSVGLVFMAVNDLMFRGYYALHDMKTPMIFAGIGVAVNIALNLLLIGSMAHEGLALATSMAAMVNSILLVIGFRRKGKELNFLESPKKYGKIVLSAFVSVGLSKLVHVILVMNVWMPRMLYLGIAVFVAVCAYWLLLKAFKIEEIDLVKGLFKRG